MQKTWMGMLKTKFKSERRNLTDVEEVVENSNKCGHKSAKRSLQTVGQDVPALNVARWVVYNTFY